MNLILSIVITVLSAITAFGYVYLGLIKERHKEISQIIEGVHACAKAYLIGRINEIFQNGYDQEKEDNYTVEKNYIQDMIEKPIKYTKLIYNIFLKITADNLYNEKLLEKIGYKGE